MSEQAVEVIAHGAAGMGRAVRAQALRAGRRLVLGAWVGKVVAARELLRVTAARVSGASPDRVQVRHGGRSTGDGNDHDARPEKVGAAAGVLRGRRTRVCAQTVAG